MSLRFDDCVQVTFSPTDGTLNPIPTVWLFAVDQGGETGSLVLSGEYSTGTHTTINFAVFNPFIDLLGTSSARRETGVDWGCTWTQVVELVSDTDDPDLFRQLSDHWHIYAHGYHWVSYSVKVGSAETPAEIWLAVISVHHLATDGTASFILWVHRQLGYVSGVGWPYRGVELPNTCATNDHFLVATEDGVAVGVFKHAAGADGPGHCVLFFSLKGGLDSDYTEFGTWAAADNHKNLAGARALSATIDIGVHEHLPSGFYGKLDGHVGPNPPHGSDILTHVPPLHILHPEGHIGVLAPDPNLDILGLITTSSAATSPSVLLSGSTANQVIAFRTDDTFREAATSQMTAEIGPTEAMNTKATFVALRADARYYVTVYQGIEFSVTDDWPSPPGSIPPDYDYGELYREVWTDGFASLDDGPTVLTGSAASLTAAGVATGSIPADPLNCSRPHTLLTQYDGDAWLVTTFDTWDGTTKTCGMHLTRVSS